MSKIDNRAPSLSTRRRTAGLVAWGVLFVLALVWWRVDVTRRRDPVYPHLPASLLQFANQHMLTQNDSPMYRSLKCMAVQGPHDARTASRPAPESALDRLLRKYSSGSNGRYIRMLKTNYTPLIEGDDRIGGTQAWVLRLKPKVKHRPWRQLWIDKSTFELLAYREWSHLNELRAKDSGAKASQLDKASSPRILSPLQSTASPEHIPSGFQLVGARNYRSRNTTHFIYSDGLFAISVFRTFPIRQGREHKEMASVYGSKAGLVLRQTLDGVETVVVADLPEEEIRRIADSL